MYDLMIYSLKVGVCLAVFYLFFKLLLSRETFHRFNRIVLLGAMVLSFVLPLCVITVYRELPVLPESPAEEAVTTVAVEPPAEPFPWEKLAGGAFVAGAVVTLLGTCRSLFGVVRLVRRGSRERLEDGSVLVRTDRAVTPFSWGRYIVMSGKDLAENGDAILLRVTVIEQDGKLRIAAVHTEDPESTGEGKRDDFDNLYSAGELEVHKDVEGIMGNKEKYFEFRVQLTGEEGKTYQDSYAITGGSYDANPTSIKIRPGETTEATFYLKDDDTIHIENLPYGVEYKVSETPVADYVTTETGTEGEVDAAVEQANFTNTKGGTVDAGVVLDSAPYLFTLTGAAGVGLLLTLRRRHQK